MTLDTAGHIPQLTRGWRLKMALSEAGIHVQEMADYLRVDRQTVGRWLNDRNEPPRAALIAIHLKTGVPLEWLEHGTEPPGGGDGDDGLPWFDSNEQPSGYRPNRRDQHGLGILVPLLVA